MNGFGVTLCACYSHAQVFLPANTAIDVTEDTPLLLDFSKACCAIRHTINPHRMLIYMPKIYFSLGVGINFFVYYSSIDRIAGNWLKTTDDRL